MTMRALVARTAVAGAVAVLAGALAQSASAASGWLHAETLGNGAKFAECQVRTAMDAAGEALAVWTTTEGVQLASRPPGGSWQLAPPVSYGGGVCPEQLRADERGDAVAMWERFDGTNTFLEASYRPAGGSWQAPAQLAIGAKNSEVITGSVALDAGGNATAIWRSDVTHKIETAYRLATGSWSVSGAIAPDTETGYGLDLGVDPRGDAVAVWQHLSGGHEVVESAYYSVGSFTWKAAEKVSTEANPVFIDRPVVAMNAGGGGTVAFEHETAGTTVVQVATLTAGGVWQLPVTVGEALAERAQVAVDPNGDSVVVWEHPAGKETLIEGAGMPVAGTWQAPSVLSSGGAAAYKPSTAADARGDGVALWEVHGPSVLEVQASGYDAGAPPTLSAVSIPAQGVAGQPVPFSVLTQVLWSPIAVDGWSFGDSGVAEGASVAHTFAKAGSYRVTVTSTDLLGNSASASGTIAIAAAGSPPPLPPLLGGLRQSHRVWREGSAPARISRRPRAPVGTKFTFTLAVAARVGLAFTQPQPGRAVGGRCVARTHANAHRRACRRTITRATLSLSGHAGVNTIVFQGRISRSRRLALGSYTLLLTARAREGRSATGALTFTIVR